MRAEGLDSSAATINTDKYTMAPSKYTTVNNPTATLNNGQKIPLFGLGTWRGEAGQVEKAVEMSLKAGYRYDRGLANQSLTHTSVGVSARWLHSQNALPMLTVGTSEISRVDYRHIDCAAAYGNEDVVGEGFAQIFKEGNVKRKDVWITSKLNNPDHGRVREACEQTIKDLQAEYLDLYLMHWPLTGNKGKTVEPPIKVQQSTRYVYMQQRQMLWHIACLPKHSPGQSASSHIVQNCHNPSKTM